jgi:hypothetical protein
MTKLADGLGSTIVAVDFAAELGTIVELRAFAVRQGDDFRRSESRLTVDKASLGNR